MLNSIFGLIIALGILVAIHEFGHFWVARRFGVKVLRFSIGFGRPIWQKTDRFGTEFAIAWIPLGGYVKMLDEREGEVPEGELDQAFTQKTPAQKILIALAGPVANFLFAFAAFAFMYMVGVRDLAPIIDLPSESSPAFEQGFERGDRIVKIDGSETLSFTDLGIQLASRVGDTGRIEFQVERNGVLKKLEIDVESWLSNEQSPNPIRALGFGPKMPIHPALIGRVEAGGAAETAGLMAGDVVVEVNGQAVTQWIEWVEIVRANPETALQVVALRESSRQEFTLIPKLKENGDQPSFGYVGAATEPMSWPDEQLITVRHWPLKAVAKGIGQTFDIVVLSYEMLGKMVTGKVSLKQIGGPISMAQMAGMSVESGFEAFIGFLALISISLGIVNLLPVPVLDGGHVVIHSIEWITRKPLSEKAQIVGMQIGMAFILTLMALAFFNDIGRLL